jgi:Protein of unknown function (DUF2917)
MRANHLLDLHQSNEGPALLGRWTLAPGRAISLQSSTPRELRVRHGRMWLTLDGPHAGHGNESGDYFLKAGQVFAVPAGHRVVFESWAWADAGTEPVEFEWVLTFARPRNHPVLRRIKGVLEGISACLPSVPAHRFRSLSNSQST